LARRFERVIRYIAAGAGVTLFYSLATILLVSGGIETDPAAASVVASLITFPVAFVVHRAVTYVDVPFDRAQWIRFGIIALCNLMIAAGSMKAVDLLQMPYGIGLAIGWVLIPAFNYTINAVWVFRTATFLSLRADDMPAGDEDAA
jgi:putative flippase GtrA